MPQNSSVRDPYGADDNASPGSVNENPARPISKEKGPGGASLHQVAAD